MAAEVAAELTVLLSGNDGFFLHFDADVAVSVSLHWAGFPGQQ